MEIYRQNSFCENEASVCSGNNPADCLETPEESATDSFTKTTIGFVVQTFRKSRHGRFVCTHQEFIASDQGEYEDTRGHAIAPPDYEYQPYHMTLKRNAPNEVTRGG